jgi:flagellar basal-body rod modification protein FlgD
MTTPVGAIPTTPVGALPSTTTTSSTATQGSDSLGEDAFLQLLVAQLKYQDPMKPEDSSTFMAQTAQFNSLSKLTSIDSTDTALLGTQGFLEAASLVGRSVTYTGADGTEASGIVKSASFGSNGPTLRVGDKDVPISEITTIAPGTTG